MTYIKYHCLDSKYYLGDMYKHVHLFLDQYADIFDVKIFDEYHRTFLHNSYGLTIIKAKWGKEAEIAGKIHLYRDFLHHSIIPESLENILTYMPEVLVYFNGFYWKKDIDLLKLREIRRFVQDEKLLY